VRAKASNAREIAGVARNAANSWRFVSIRETVPCTSPKTQTKLKPGKHVFHVKARDRAGNLDATPVVKRFQIKKH
jgi:hypothetical protein